MPPVHHATVSRASKFEQPALLHGFTSSFVRCPAQYTLISKRSVQRRYGFDIVAVRANSVEYDEAVAFFQQVRHQPALRKGILRLNL
jgi:hypothetical protein